MIEERGYREVLQLEGLGVQDRYNVYTTTKTIVKETKTEFLNDLFEKAMKTGSDKDFSALHLQDLKVSIFKEFRSKVKNTVRNLMQKVLKKEPNSKESLIEKLENISKDTFDAILKARVPRYKLDQVFTYLQKKAKKESRKLPQYIVDSFIKKSILGPSIDSKLVENSFVKDIKEAIDTIMNNWALTSDQDKEETIKRFELLLGEAFRYTDFEDNWFERGKEFSKKLQKFILEMRSYVRRLIQDASNDEKTLPDFKHICSTLCIEDLSKRRRKRNISHAKYNVPYIRILDLKKEEYLALLRENGRALRFIPRKKHTREMVLTAIKNDAWAILDAAPRFENDKEMLAAVLQNCKRLFIIPLVRIFIPRGNQGSFRNDVRVAQLFRIEGLIRSMKLIFSLITLDNVKHFFNELARGTVSQRRDILNAIKALLRTPQNLYTAITNVTLQQIKKILSDIFIDAADIPNDVLKALNRGFNELVEIIKNIPNGLKYFLRAAKEILRILPQVIREIVFLFLRTFKNVFDLNNDITRFIATVSLGISFYTLMLYRSLQTGLFI